MEIKTITKILTDEGRITLKDKDGLLFDLIVPHKWSSEKDDAEGIFLLFDLFQIRGIAEQFSEVALDIVEFSEKPVIFHTPAGRALPGGPITEGNVKFLMLKKGFWNTLLFNFGKPLVFQKSRHNGSEYILQDNFPMAHRSLYLGPDGDVKILD
ncbi:hypothetical protein [Anditalea andensis]|uniref:Uncharacterized protein n=1 Tax=Anditalea andensis TaxID=1048983 RepID=A0A074KRR7_9BACT|nr:hypothetical protein [Anditalea andensis]KEO72626.1 hypothetical protein EL17_17970 [Anditalea andensis]